MIVVFTGGRNFGEAVDHRGCKREPDQVRRELALFNATFPLFQRGNKVYVGCARGLDSLVRNSAQLQPQVFSADWTKEGRAAGPLRNGRMLRAAIRHRDEIGVMDPNGVLLVAYPGGNGTEDCVLQARRAGFAVVRVELGQV